MAMQCDFFERDSKFFEKMLQSQFGKDKLTKGVTAKFVIGGVSVRTRWGAGQSDG